MSSDKISILIVDDELYLLEIYQELFEEQNFKVFTASSASAGLEIYAKNLDIRLIISDHQMKNMTGLEFMQKLKSTYSAVPVFYLITGNTEESESKIKELGVHSLVLKPFDVDEIIMKIKKDLNL